ncbi:MAG: beta-lactamase family protein [Phycisphaerales bacterium]|nr:beta-lactamase family protein [Phycisphaerales bacterium]
MDSKRRIVGAILLGLVVVGPARWAAAQEAPPARAVHAPEVSALRERLKAWRARTGASGVTAACAVDDETVVSASAGQARLEPPAPMPADGRMLSGSTGKTYCVAVMLQLVEAGRARLDDKIAVWLGDEPWFDRLPNARAITLRMLMNHTSGVPEHVQLAEFTAAIAEAPQRVWKPAELVAFILDKPAACEAGKGWSYADTNYILVGMIIERITGRAFYDEARTRLLEPLKLERTSPSDRPALEGLVSGYTGPGNPFPVPREVAVGGVYAINPQFEWTGGGYISSSADLARWARLLWGGRVLKPETMQEVSRGVKAKTGPDDEYGLGVQMWPSRHGPVMAHTGWFPGYVTLMAYYPERGVAVAVQVNTDSGKAVKGLRGLADELVDACLPGGE